MINFSLSAIIHTTPLNLPLTAKFVGVGELDKEGFLCAAQSVYYCLCSNAHTTPSHYTPLPIKSSLEALEGFFRLANTVEWERGEDDIELSKTVCDYFEKGGLNFEVVEIL